MKYGNKLLYKLIMVVSILRLCYFTICHCLMYFFSVKECKNRWKDMQNSYCEEKKKRNGKSSNSAKKLKELPYLSLMMFLDDF